MKQRITYLLHEAGGVDPETLDVGKDSIKLPGLKAAKEWRVTLGTRELPKEVSSVLEQSHEIHIRWSAEWNYDAVTPFSSRVPSGFHVFYTPGENASSDTLCPLLGQIIGDAVECASVKESFSTPPILSERFAMSAKYQYYKPLARLTRFIGYLSSTMCDSSDVSCHSQVASLAQASSLDLDYDMISHALRVTAYWDWAVAADGSQGVWDETLHLQPSSDALEVGILNVEKANEEGEIALSGLLTVVGEDTKPSATMFSFPARHHAVSKQPEELSFETSFRQPTGLHPALELKFPANALIQPDESCALHAYLTLPSSVFIDRYQLSDPLFLASQNLIALRSLSGATDLEAPVWTTPQWGSAALLELAHPETPSVNNDTWSVTVPLHTRYMLPSTDGTHIAHIPWPAVFWACEAEDGLKMSVNPFDRTNIGYDGLFGPKTLFHHIGASAETKTLMETLEVPVLDKTKTGFVEIGTGVTVLLGFLWVLWSMIKGNSKATSEAGKKE
ncbi:PIG-X-domain-containing protein [Aureobasidium pullulans]|nr:PIG-X-domain-containing protein [Aureobasidium pullulans]